MFAKNLFLFFTLLAAIHGKAMTFTLLGIQ